MGVAGRADTGDSEAFIGSVDTGVSDKRVRIVPVASSTAGGNSAADGVGGGKGLSNPIGVRISTTCNEGINSRK